MGFSLYSPDPTVFITCSCAPNILFIILASFSGFLTYSKFIKPKVSWKELKFVLFILLTLTFLILAAIFKTCICF